MSTLEQCVAAAREGLHGAGIPSTEAALDARILAQHVLGWSSATMLVEGRQRASEEFVRRYDAIVRRRAAREPVAYITGVKEFWNLDFAVSPEVLIPRPETEILVEAALEHLPPHGSSVVADVCTGSGCVAVALAHERPGIRVSATDLSPGALDIARRNAARHHLEKSISFARADLLEGVSGPFDLIVSNPPYVRAIDRGGLQPEVRDHEPAMALFGGADGLDLIRRLLEQAAARLGAGGQLMFEFGDGQESSVSELISDSPALKMVSVRSDLQGIARVAITARR